LQIGYVIPGSGSFSNAVLMQPSSTGNTVNCGLLGTATTSKISDLGKLNTITNAGSIFCGGNQSFLPVAAGYNSATGAGGVTINAAQLIGQLFSHTGASTAITDTTDTAANIVAALPQAFPGFWIPLKIMNFNSSTLTIAGGSGVSNVGNNVIAAGASYDFILFINNVSSPACTLYG
jgi:hypothetical protein